MKEVYDKIAASFDKLAKCYRELSNWDITGDNEINSDKIVNQSEDVTIEKIRAVLSEKSKIGKTKEVKELLSKFGAKKLSQVKEEDFTTLMLESQKL